MDGKRDTDRQIWLFDIVLAGIFGKMLTLRKDMEQQVFSIFL